MTSPLALVLAILLGITGFSVAVARGQSPMLWSEICSGQGVIMVALDEKGHPAGPAHLCPDGAILLFAATPAVPWHVARPATRSEPVRCRSAAHSLTATAPPAIARGPPGFSS